jgi:anti-sigma factor RsiW
MTKRTFSDEDLSCYLDGEATDTLVQEIEAAVAQDVELAQYLEDLRDAQAMFVGAQEELLAAAPEMPILPASSRAPRDWATGLAGLAAGLVLAMTAAWTFWERPEPGWRDVVASYQSLYVTETLIGASETPTESTAKLEELSDVLGFDLTGLPTVGGLDYRRAQQLGYKGQPLAQLTYLTSEGGPVALCIVFTGDSTTDGIQKDTLEGLDAYSWVENGYGILLIGPYGEAILPSAAETFRDALSSKSS